MRDLGMELHAVDGPALVAEGCITTGATPPDREIPARQLGHLVAVAHPDLGLFVALESLEQSLWLLDLEHRSAVFSPVRRRRYAAPLELHDQVHAVADTEDRRDVENLPW